MRPAPLLIFLAALSFSGCAGHHPAPETAPSHSAFKSFGLQGPVGPAFDAAQAALIREKLPLELSSREAGVLRTAWGPADGETATGPRMRFEVTLSPGLCILHAVIEHPEGAGALSPAESATMDRVVAALAASFAEAGAAAPLAAAPTATPPPRNAFEAAQRAMERCGLRVQNAREATGRVESSWNDSETGILMPAFPQQSSLVGAAATGDTAPPQIYYRVRYVVEVTGTSAAARTELEKSTDERSWLPRSGSTKKEDQALDKLRRALSAELAAVPSGGPVRSAP